MPPSHPPPPPDQAQDSAQDGAERPPARGSGPGQALDHDYSAGPHAAQALRASYPMGVWIAEPHSRAQWQQAFEHTAHCIHSGVLQDEGGAVLGACLASDDGALARIDVLAHAPRGAQVLRLRHATAGNDADVDAVAWGVHVAARSGLRVTGAALLLVDTDFVYPGHGLYAGLYRQADLWPVLGARPAADWIVAMRRCERAPEPEACPGSHCHERMADGRWRPRPVALVPGEPPPDSPEGCPWLRHCGVAPAAEAPDPARLEVLGRDWAELLRAEGHQRLVDVPPARLAAPAPAPAGCSQAQRERLGRMLRAVQARRPLVQAEARAQLQALPWPRHLLRIDTIGFAIPAWAGTRPYQVLPFQWTSVRQQADGSLQQWQGFLAPAGGDPRAAFARSLVQALDGVGAVLAYNAGFERNRIAELAAHLAQLGEAALAAQLQALLPRIADLYPLMRQSAYHPQQAGSWSFRAVARALAPALTVGPWIDAPGALGPDDRPVTVQELFAATLRPGASPAALQRWRAKLQAHGRHEVQVLEKLVAWLMQPQPLESPTAGAAG